MLLVMSSFWYSEENVLLGCIFQTSCQVLVKISYVVQPANEYMINAIPDTPGKPKAECFVEGLSDIIHCRNCSITVGN